MIVCNDLFDYGYKIYQNTDYFKFSVDSILLAEFVDFKKDDRILDLCSGNAPIPLILSSKKENLSIEAVELQESIFKMAQESIKINGFENIKIHNKNVKDFYSEHKFDIVTCNPPYFKVNATSLMNDNKVKSIARHEISITLEDIIQKSNEFLTEMGTLYLVHKPERFIETINLLQKYHFGIRKVVFIYTKMGNNAEFFLIKATKNKKNDPKIRYLNINGLKTYKNIFKEVR